MDDETIVLQPRAALELLGKLTEGRPLVEAHAVARAIGVQRPSRDEEQPEDRATPRLPAEVFEGRPVTRRRMSPK